MLPFGDKKTLVYEKVIKIYKFMYVQSKTKKFKFSRIALNRLLTLPDYSTGHCVVVALKIIDFENKNISVVTKH